MGNLHTPGIRFLACETVKNLPAWLVIHTGRRRLQICYINSVLFQHS